jgi:hypothetical protein
VTDDRANELVAADIVAFGSGLMALQSCASLFTVEFEELEISLPAEVELPSGLGRAETFALAFNEHGQAADGEVIGQNGELSGRANDAVGRQVELHGWVSVFDFAIGGRSEPARPVATTDAATTWGLIAKGSGARSAYRPTGRPRKPGFNRDAGPGSERGRDLLFTPRSDLGI